MKGKVRVPLRSSRCPKCGEPFVDIGKKGFVCADCLTVPERYYLDICYRGERVRVFSDRQGKVLDTFERAFDLLAHINYEINDRSFDPSRYVRSEQKEFYVCTQLGRYESHKVDSLAPSYKTDFKRNIRIAKGFFGNRDIREIRKAHVVGFLEHLQSNFTLSNKTIKNIMDVFKAFLNYLKNDLEIISTVPKFPEIEIEVRPVRWFSPDDQIEIFSFVPELFRDITAFLVLHGCRPSEARALKCKNVDLDKKTITIAATFSGVVYREKRKGKRSQAVTIPMHPESYDYISYRVKNNLPEAFLFVNAGSGRPFGKNSLQRMWARARKKAGLSKDVRLYDFTRHSFVTNHLNSGTSLWKVSKMAGHSSTRTTEKVYAHVDVEGLRVEVPKLSLKCHQSVIKEIAGVK